MASAEEAGLPFIGSLMSLISVSDIRYEGTLYSIDMPNSQIALSNGEAARSPGVGRHGILYNKSRPAVAMPYLLSEGCCF
jgi:hypothetical protein